MFYEGVMNGQVSTRELERRWSAVRTAMKEQNIDVLFAVSNSDQLGGHVRYLLDLPSGASYPTTMIFPRDDEITMVVHGSYLGDKSVVASPKSPLRGVKRILTAPAFSSVWYTKTYEAEMANRALEPFARARIGVLYPTQIPYPMMDYIRQGALSKADIFDASELLDEIKAVKSEEEIGLMRGVARLQDEGVRLAFEAIKPGMEERHVSGIANQYMRAHGSEQGILMSGSGPVGTPSGIRVPFMQGGRIEAGYQYHLLLEVNGQEGFYVELGRSSVLGKASNQMQDEFQHLLRIRQITLDMLRPGTPCKDIWHAHNRYMRDNGLAEEKRLYGHSQGYDLVERPLIRWDENMVVKENMVFAVHPMLPTSTSFTWICDDFLVRADGPPERLHAFPEKIFELG
jgi:Xaa-Pro aminopeptidase